MKAVSRTLALTIAIAVVSGIAQIALAWWRPWHPGRWGGLVFGILAATLFGIATLYGARRKLRARPFGTARRWLDVHIYGGVLAMVFVLLHENWTMPHGVMGWLLFGLALWTTVGGLVGRWLQRRLAEQLARDVSYESIYERIPHHATALAKAADALMEGASESFARAYRGDIRPALASPVFSLGWVSRGAAMRAAVLAPLAGTRDYVAPADRDRVEGLEAILRDKGDLDEQFAVQRVLRGWLVLHVPPAFALLAMIVVHIMSVIWY